MSHAIRDYRDSREVVIDDSVGFRSGSRVERWAARIPLFSPIVVAAACVAIATFAAIARTIATPQPQNPWEAGSIVEAWRVNHALPLYEWPRVGHATLMYGPLGPWVLAAAFRLTGTAAWTGRALQLVSALLIVALLLVICVRKQSHPPLFVFAAGAIFLGIDAPAGHYFVTNRPDMTALLFGAIGLVTLWHAVAKRNDLVFAAGVGSLLFAMLFKQTMMMLCAVPAIPILLDDRMRRARRLTLAATPLAAAIALMLTLKVTAPVVYHYMVTVPKQYRIIPTEVVNGVSALAAAIPLFPVCMALWLAKRDREDDKLMVWVLCALAITIPASILTYAKQGGAANSLLPALFAMAFFTALQLPALLEPLKNVALPTSRRLAFGAVVAVLLGLGGLHAVLTAGRNASFEDYPSVVKEIARLAPSRVVSPEDPSIALAASGTVGRSIYLEYDALGWPPTLADYMADEIRNADYVVDVRDWWQDLVRPETLERLGFVQTAQFKHYGIWRRR